jgi:20S proteasome alpha/beta subunit
VYKGKPEPVLTPVHEGAMHPETMTLLVALSGRDGLVLAADSRGTFGDPRGVTAQNDSQQKAHILSVHVAALQAGVGEVGALIIQHVRERVAATGVDGVTPVMNALRETARTSYDEWFPSVPPIPAPQLVMTGQAPARPDLAFIVAGYELQEGVVPVPRLYQLGSATDFAPMVHDYGFAVAGVAQYALYLLNRLYEADRSVQELQALAVYVVTETASQDGKVGGPVKLVTIAPDAGGVLLDPTEVVAIANQNEGRSQALRDSFYGRSRDE